MYRVAMEAALKLKEISYIHAEGYPAGEMKHGPIALIDEEMLAGARDDLTLRRAGLPRDRAADRRAPPGA